MRQYSFVSPCSPFCSFTDQTALTVLHVPDLFCRCKGLSLPIGSPRVTVQQTCKDLQDQKTRDTTTFVPGDNIRTTFWINSRDTKGIEDQATTATSFSFLDHCTKHVVNSLNGIDILYPNILPLNILLSTFFLSESWLPLSRRESKGLPSSGSSLQESRMQLPITNKKLRQMCDSASALFPRVGLESRCL
jgi:hypothetical protein